MSDRYRRGISGSVDAIFTERLIGVRNTLLLTGALEFFGDAVWQFEQAAVRAATNNKTANNMESWAIGIHF